MKPIIQCARCRVERWLNLRGHAPKAAVFRLFEDGFSIRLAAPIGHGWGGQETGEGSAALPLRYNLAKDGPAAVQASFKRLIVEYLQQIQKSITIGRY